MLKFLVITFLIGYLIFKLIGFAFRSVLRSSASSYGQQQSNQQSNYSGKKPSDGNVNIDYVPKKDQRDKKNFKGGEYVDFEEIK